MAQWLKRMFRNQDVVILSPSCTLAESNLIMQVMIVPPPNAQHFEVRDVCLLDEVSCGTLVFIMFASKLEGH